MGNTVPIYIELYLGTLNRMIAAAPGTQSFTGIYIGGLSSNSQPADHILIYPRTPCSNGNSALKHKCARGLTPCGKKSKLHNSIEGMTIIPLSLLRFLASLLRVFVTYYCCWCWRCTGWWIGWRRGRQIGGLSRHFS